MTAPPQEVLEAFGLRGTATALVGGEGRSFRVGDAVLKPAEADAGAARWLAETMAAVREDGFRVARPLRTTTGAWVHEGWTAARHVEGEAPDFATEARWLDIMEAGRAFHRALTGLPRPDFLDRRTDPWWVGDQVAWQERPPDRIAPWLRGPYEVLEQCLGPAPADRPQLVHGDLTGNVLFELGLAPAVIDFSPYWRPAPFGEAVVVGDALIWHGAGAALLSEVAEARSPDFLRHVARAVVYRLVTSNQWARTEEFADTAEAMPEARRFERAAKLVADVIH